MAQQNPWYESINSAALSRYPAILHEWIPNGRVSGTQYEGPDPTATGSIKVNIGTGAWKNFSAGYPGGSNAISLYARLKNLEYREAAKELAALFAIEQPRPLKLVTSGPWEPITPIPDFAPCDENGLPAFPALGNTEAEIKGMWCYFSRDGEPLAWRVRLDRADGSKDVMPLTFCRNAATGATEWRWKDLPAPRPLYGLEWLAIEPVPQVLIVEGEKTADAARRLLGEDWTVITWSGGTQRVSTKQTDWSPVFNLPATARIVLWPDADDPGIKAMAQLADILKGRCQIVRPDPAWPKGWDLADAEAQGWTGAQVLEYLETHAIRVQADTRARVEVEISGADLDNQSRAIWNALSAVNNPPELVDSATGLSIVDRDVFGAARRQVVTIDRLRHWLTARMQFKRRDKDGELVSAVPHDNLLRNLLVYSKPPVPFLRRLTEVPVLAPNGALVVREGLDEASGIYYLPHPTVSDIDVPSKPTAEQITAAVALIDDMLADFPFVEACDRAHAFAFALVPLIRMTIQGRTPMFRFEAPQPRTGKSLLMRVLARLTCATISDMGPTEDEEEWRKRITAALRREPDAFLIDNVNSLESTNLKKLLTDDVWEDRALGASENVRYPVQCVIGVTINNPIIGREIMGRSLRVRLDAKAEHPELRSGFRHPNLEEYVIDARPALVAALLTIAQAASEPKPDAATLGGYEAFCRRMAAILEAAGIDGFLGDRKDETSLSSEENALVGLVEAWGRKYGQQKVTTADLVWIAQDVEGLDLGRGDSDRGKQTALAMFLRKHRGATVGEWQIEDPSPTRPTRWSLINRNGAATPLTPFEHDEGGREGNDTFDTF